MRPLFAMLMALVVICTMSSVSAAASNPDASPIATPEPVSFVYTNPGDGNLFKVTVTTWETVTTGIEDTIYNKTLTPKGKYIVVFVDATNNSLTPSSYLGLSDLYLRDQKGRMFSYDSDATFAKAFALDLYVDAFQPSLTYKQVIVWDVATDAKRSHLMVKGTDVDLLLP